MTDQPMAVAKQALLARLPEIVAELAPGGHRSGKVWQGALNPGRPGDRHGGSFVVWLSGAAAGGWKDYATGSSGDIIDLVVLAKGGSRKDALKWAQGRCNIRPMSAEERRAFAARATTNRQVVVTQDEDQARRRRRACMLFGQAEKTWAGTALERYLAARGFRRDWLVDSSIEWRWIRFIRCLEHWLTPQRPEFPTMAWAMVDRQGMQRAIHLTFLTPDGAGKAPVAKPKLVFPQCSGLVIRIAKGGSGLSPEQAAAAGKSGPILLCEGVEDGLSAAVADPSLRVWAAYSLSNLANVPDHPCADGFVVARDNDWGKPQAGAQFDRAVRSLRRHGKPVAVVSSSEGKDLNDQLRGQAA